MNARRILFVSPTAPDDRSFGGALRSNVLLEALRQCGDVTTLVLTPGNHDSVRPHADSSVAACITFRHAFLPWPSRSLKAVRKAIDAALQGREFDLVVVRYLLLGLYVRPCVQAPFVLDADDLSKRHVKESAPPLQRLIAGARKFARDTVARAQLGRYSHVWFVNKVDMASFAHRSGSMLPNITRLVNAAPDGASASPTVLFVGNLEYGPNVQAVDYFLSNCWPDIHRRLPAAQLRIVGKRSGASGERWNAVAGVQSLGFVDDLAGEYRRAGLVIAPVFSGGGTQIKVLEALAHARAVVVSDFVCSGFKPYLVDGEHFLVANTPAQWVALCIDLLEDRTRAMALASAGRDAVRRHYSPEGFSRAVEATVKALLK